jgi:hypothetical protein
MWRCPLAGQRLAPSLAQRAVRAAPMGKAFLLAHALATMSVARLARVVGNLPRDGLGPMLARTESAPVPVLDAPQGSTRRPQFGLPLAAGYVAEVPGECVALARNAKCRCLARRSSSSLCS